MEADEASLRELFLPERKGFDTVAAGGAGDLASDASRGRPTSDGADDRARGDGARAEDELVLKAFRDVEAWEEGSSVVVEPWLASGAAGDPERAGEGL